MPTLQVTEQKYETFWNKKCAFSLMSIMPKKVSDFQYYKPNMGNDNLHCYTQQKFQCTAHHISHKSDLAWSTKHADRPVL